MSFTQLIINFCISIITGYLCIHLTETAFIQNCQNKGTYITITNKQIQCTTQLKIGQYE